MASKAAPKAGSNQAPSVSEALDSVLDPAMLQAFTHNPGHDLLRTASALLAEGGGANAEMRLAGILGANQGMARWATRVAARALLKRAEAVTGA